MKIAYLIDSSAAMNEDPKNDLYLLPLSIVVNENGHVNEFKDRNDFSLEKLFTYQERANTTVTTSQASIGDITTKIESLMNEYDLLIAIPISRGLSANFDALSQFTKKYRNRLVVLDCKTVQLGIEWLIKDIREYVQANQNVKISEIEKINKTTWNRNYGVLTVTNPAQLVHGGRLSAMKGYVIKIMGLRLLIELQTDNQGKLAYAGKSFSENGAVEKMLDIINSKIDLKNKKIENFGFLSTIIDPVKEEEIFQLCKSKIEDYCGYKGNIVRRSLSTTIAVHTGINTYVLYAKVK